MININKNDRKIMVNSPYNEEFISFARSLNGKWNNEEKVWEFNALAEKKINKALYEIYKYNPLAENIKLKAKVEDIKGERKTKYGKYLLLGDYKLVARTGRDKEVTFLDPSVYLIKGEFLPSGGSGGFPEVTATEGAEIIFEIDKAYLGSLSEEERNKFEIVEDVQINKEKLQKEKEELLKRIEEIERMLNL